MDLQQKTFQIQKIISMYLLPPEGVDIPAVLKLCRPHMTYLCKSDEPEDWAAYSYNWLLGTFYPDAYGDAAEKREERSEAVRFFLDVLNGLFEREYREQPFDPCRNFALLSKEEHAYTTIPKEYDRMVRCFSDNYLYVFMRLSRVVTPYNTLGHICGVHHVAMYMARQIIHTDTEVDLGIASGAALIHDVGKYGCRSKELRRVPYLHYYYTYDFAERFHLSRIGAIASNHSVWDLELENLSIESLLLIYADFRVKSIYSKEKGEEIRFWTLDESYDIILGKLDNVDEAKRLRYARVYAKLKDFEDFLISIGCSTDLKGSYTAPAPKTDPTLMTKPQIVEEYKQLSIASNLLVMANVAHVHRFIDVLESIRSEKNWRHVRAYLTVLGEYCTYLNQKQKDIVLDFLYDTLSHTEGDIRRQAAHIAGEVLATYDISFKKELPEETPAPVLGTPMTSVWKNFLDKLLDPGHMVPELHRRWKGYSMKTVLRTLLEKTSGNQRREVLDIFMSHYDIQDRDPLTAFILLDAAQAIARDYCEQPQRDKQFTFALNVMPKEACELKAVALDFIYAWLKQGSFFLEGEETLLLSKLNAGDRSEPPCIRFLTERILNQIAPGSAEPEIFDPAEIYLENQRSETPWYYKQINMEILRKQLSKGGNEYELYQYASHLLSIHQFADRIVNKLQAGDNLVAILPLLNETQKTEIVLELIRSIEMGEYVVSKYIPSFLGRMYVCLSTEDRLALLDRFKALMDSTNPRVAVITLETLGVIMEHLPELKDRGLKEEEILKIEGMLGIGLAHYEPEVTQEAFYTIGHGIFGSRILSIEDKKNYFLNMARGTLAYMNWEKSGLYAYYSAAALHHIYRFISDYLLDHEIVPVERPDKVAFFPGTFDPFSLGHKAIVKEISKLGFTVYLASDEFSWSKKTQPYRIRRKIMAMSVVDIKNVYLFPEELPINIASPRDLKKLRKAFDGQEVYIVSGSDVIANASAYRMPVQEDSIHTFPHIIFDRADDGLSDPEDFKAFINREILFLKLPIYYENMSSSLIRDNVSANKDIGNLVETRVQNYIYARNLYSMEPMFKKAARTRPIGTRHLKTLNSEEGAQLKKEFFPDTTYWVPEKDQAVVLVDENDNDRPLAAVVFGILDAHELYHACGDIELAARLRNMTSGPLVVILHIAGPVDRVRDLRLTALNEVLSLSQEKGYSYAVCFESEPYDELLRLEGFLPVPGTPGLTMVDMRRPIAMIFDTPPFIKEPFCDDPAIQKVIWQCHKKLRKEMAKLYPGNLVLGYESDIINHRLIQLITKSNTFPEEQYTKKRLGTKMCVPFGKVLRGVLVPDCVTKDLNTEKVYNVDMDGFDILQYPEYAPLKLQIRAIGSFERPIILVDDVYHKGFRMDSIRHDLASEGVELDKIVVGVLSGRGRDQANFRHMDVESPYFVPKMRSWIIESDLYPFLGGDGIHTPDLETEQLQFLPSVNMILPYHVPSYMRDASMEALYNMSRVSIENARDIFKILERQYQKQYGRKLTLMRMSEIVAEPRIPDGTIMDFSMLQDAPSTLLEIELKKLKRLRHLLDGEFKY